MGLRRLRNRSWWIAVLFAVGSTCFLLGPLPGFVQLVGSAADGVVFFAGSVFFTAAALLACLETRRDEGREVRAANLVQLAGTVFFNLSTFESMQAGLDTAETDRLVWAPDAFGSVCFLISGVLAYAAVRSGAGSRGERTAEWRIAVVNLAGCVAFGAAAVASYVVPDSGSILDLAAANAATALGALCFLIGALLLAGTTGELRSPGAASSSPRSPRR